MYKTDNLVTKLASTKTEETLFNPYNQICKYNDINTAPGVRQGNLRLYLESYTNVKIDTLWVFSTADYCSTKLSGVPQVNPQNYRSVESVLKISTHFENANKNNLVSNENKLHNKIWDVISKQSTHSLIWNVLPFYPHDITDVSIERNPTKDEYVKYGEFIRMIIDIYKPKTVLAVGQKTKDALRLLNIKSRLYSIEE